jgi:hypothetical protein
VKRLVSAGLQSMVTGVTYVSARAAGTMGYAKEPKLRVCP